MEGKPEKASTFAAFATVLCLDCGAVYAKPVRGGTVRSNPGCPECGYVGWLTERVPVRPSSARRRSDEGPPLGRSAQSR
jgi:hypothetical protein